MINNIMKAKARFLTLLICMISLVGFGAVTADLNHNSTADTMDCYSAVDSTVNVAILKADFKLVKEYKVTTKVGYYNVKLYENGNCQYLTCGELMPLETDNVVKDTSIGLIRHIRYQHKLKNTQVDANYFIKRCEDNSVKNNYTGLIQNIKYQHKLKNTQVDANYFIKQCEDIYHFTGRYQPPNITT